MENALYWYLELKRAGVASEMHLYAEGRHGYGLQKRGFPVCSWGVLAEKWLESVLKN